MGCKKKKKQYQGCKRKGIEEKEVEKKEIKEMIRKEIEEEIEEKIEGGIEGEKKKRRIEKMDKIIKKNKWIKEKK